MPKRRVPPSDAVLSGKAAECFATLRAESDRGSVLSGAAFLEEALEELLRSTMSQEPSVTKKCVDRLFGGDGSVGTFSAKIDLCRGLQLITQVEYEDLTQIRKLRNRFAHSYEKAKLTDPVAIQTLMSLVVLGNRLSDWPLSKKIGETERARKHFGMAVGQLSGTLHLRINVKRSRYSKRQKELLAAEPPPAT